MLFSSIALVQSQSISATTTNDPPGRVHQPEFRYGIVLIKANKEQQGSLEVLSTLREEFLSFARIISLLEDNLDRLDKDHTAVLCEVSFQ